MNDKKNCEAGCTAFFLALVTLALLIATGYSLDTRLEAIEKKLGINQPKATP